MAEPSFSDALVDLRLDSVGNRSMADTCPTAYAYAKTSIE